MVWKIPCKGCGKDKTFSEKPRKRNYKSLCRECSGKKRTKEKVKFVRTCEGCGDVKEFDRVHDRKICSKCSGKKNIADVVKGRQYKGKTSYTYFCMSCPSVRVLKAKRKTSYCSVCVRKYTKSKSKPDYIYFDMETMTMKIPKPKVRLFRICPICPESNNTKQVQNLGQAGIKPCPKHSIKEPRTHKKNIIVKAGYNKHLKAKDKQVSEQAIERERIKNREHREKVEKAAKVVVKPKSEEEMMAEYMATHTVETQGDTRPINDIHFISGNGIVGTSVLS